jgi:hypothetical protein
MYGTAQKEATAQRIARLRTAGHTVTADPDGTFERPELNALCALWRQKAQGAIPPRSAFVMRELAPFLRNIAIIERDAAGRYRYRFYGSSLVDMMGECTNKFLDEIIPPERYATWKANFDLILEHGGPLRFASDYEVPQLDYLHGESFGAPLAAENGPPVTVLGATYVKPKFDSPTYRKG